MTVLNLQPWSSSAGLAPPAPGEGKLGHRDEGEGGGEDEGEGGGESEGEGWLDRGAVLRARRQRLLRLVRWFGLG